MFFFLVLTFPFINWTMFKKISRLSQPAEEETLTSTFLDWQPDFLLASFALIGVHLPLNAEPRAKSN